MGGGVRRAGGRQRSPGAVEQDLDVAVEHLDAGDGRAQHDDDAAAAEVVDEAQAGAGDDLARDAVGEALALELEPGDRLGREPRRGRGRGGGPQQRGAAVAGVVGHRELGALARARTDRRGHPGVVPGVVITGGGLERDEAGEAAGERSDPRLVDDHVPS